MNTIILAIVLGQWGPQGCAPVGATIKQGESWQQFADSPDDWAHLRDGIQIGGYNSKRDEYRTYDKATDTWGKPEPPPWKTKFETIPDKLNMGLVLSRIGNGDKPRFSMCNGNGCKKSCRSEVMEALEGVGLVDDSHRLWVSVIGNKDDRGRVIADLATSKELEEFRGKLLVQAYTPEEWAVSDYGFATAGKPTIYIQTPTGKVESRSDEYRGPTQLAMALRKANKDYDPKRDQDLTKPEEPKPIPDKPRLTGPSFYVMPLLIFFVAAGVFLALKRNK